MQCICGVAGKDHASRPSILPANVASFPGTHTLEHKHTEVFVQAWSTAKTLIVRGRTQILRTGKRVKVAGNLLHGSAFGNIIHTQR